MPWWKVSFDSITRFLPVVNTSRIWLDVKTLQVLQMNTFCSAQNGGCRQSGNQPRHGATCYICHSSQIPFPNSKNRP